MAATAILGPSSRPTAQVAAVVTCVLSLFAAVSTCSASQDPALCPYMLGYNPTFSADGTQLYCTKGSESFLVDAQGTNVQALAGIGSTTQQLTLGATLLSQELFCENTDPDAIFYLPDGTAVRDGDPKLGAFLFSFKFAPGADVNGLFAVSNFQYLGGTPPLAKVDWWVFTLNFDVLFNATFRLNDMGNGVKVWKQYRIAATIRPRP